MEMTSELGLRAKIWPDRLGGLYFHTFANRDPGRPVRLRGGFGAAAWRDLPSATAPTRSSPPGSCLRSVASDQWAGSQWPKGSFGSAAVNRFYSQPDTPGPPTTMRLLFPLRLDSKFLTRCHLP